MITKNVITEIGRITEPHKQIHVKTITQIIEDGVVISSSNHRHVCGPDHADILDQSQVVQDVANALWTNEVKGNYADFLTPQEVKQEDNGITK